MYKIHGFHSIICWLFFPLVRVMVTYKCGHILAEAVFRLSAAPNLELAILAAARLKLTGGEMGSGPGSVAVPQRHRIRGWDSEVGHTNRLS